MADSGERRVGRFHPKCSPNVVLNKDRSVAVGPRDVHYNYVFSNDPIPIGLQFSVKILQKLSGCVSPLSAASRSHPSDAPYTAGGAVHVVSTGWEECKVAVKSLLSALRPPHPATLFTTSFLPSTSVSL